MFLVQMTSIGEESGTLDEMLGKVADQYEMQVDNAVGSMSSLIEPMIMSVLGVLVGGLMTAMFYPSSCSAQSCKLTSWTHSKNSFAPNRGSL